MNKSTLTKALAPIAIECGYSYKSGVFFKRHADLTTCFELQSTNYGGGLFSNVGVVPNEWCVDGRVPTNGHWGIHDRGESLLSESFGDAFWRLAMDDDDEMQPEEMFEPFRQILAWADSTFGNLGQIRSYLADPTSRYSLHCRVRMRDWVMAWQ